MCKESREQSQNICKSEINEVNTLLHFMKFINEQTDEVDFNMSYAAVKQNDMFRNTYFMQNEIVRMCTQAFRNVYIKCLDHKAVQIF